MSHLRDIVNDVRQKCAPSSISASDVEIARAVGDACEAMLAERNKSRQREWRDEVVQRVVTRLRAERPQ